MILGYIIKIHLKLAKTMTATKYFHYQLTDMSFYWHFLNKMSENCRKKMTITMYKVIYGSFVLTAKT